jgi:antagonist of KipI
VSTPVFEVRAPGTLSSVQDQGRTGLRALGLSVSGAADGHSAALANLLVGNPPQAALLEITLRGPRLQLARAATIAITGAEITAHCDGTPLPGWRPLRLPAGSELVLGACRRGLRAYLAVTGGLAVPAVLGSRSTDLRAGFGGLHGRPLQAGDVLCVGKAEDAGPSQPEIAGWWLDPSPDMDLALPAVAAIAPGAAALDAAAWQVLCGARYQVAPASNRMGLRLEGPPLSLQVPWDRPSEPVLPGTVQLPPDGRPIVLLGDCGSHGGYPRIGHVAAVDLPRLAQLRPGEALRFAPATLDDHDRRACERAARMARIGLALAQRRAREQQGTRG